MPPHAFSAALPFILRWEGGFVDDPDDPGGRTNKGITQRVYDLWRTRQGAAPQDVKVITDSEVHAIYEADYWMRARCDLLESPLSLVQLDTAVNMGVVRAVRFLQQVARCGVNGDFGPGTQAAVASCDQGQLVIVYCEVREAFYHAIVDRKPSSAKFLKGWLNRLNALRKEAGLPGFEALDTPLDFGDAGYIKRIPDIGVGSELDL